MNHIIMRPTKQTYKLLETKKLTKNVYELIFKGENDIAVIPGQFITFLIPGIGARAYSLFKKKGASFHFIIEKIEIKDGGKGGSKFLCELEIKSEIYGIGPSGNFILKQNDKNKIFFGTGTGFVPLYAMISKALKENFNNTLKLIFGVRKQENVFYQKELQKLENKYENFSFEIFLSREEKSGFQNGYITKYIDKNTKDNFGEAYLCGSPKVVDSVREKLEENGFDGKRIFEEKY